MLIKYCLTQSIKFDKCNFPNEYIVCHSLASRLYDTPASNEYYRIRFFF
jgi:hypothetical protein